MDSFLQSILGGAIPAIAMVCVYFFTTERRLTRIETDIAWLKRSNLLCRPPSDDHIQ